MLYFSRAKTFGIMLLCGLGILLSLPNLSARPSFWPGFLPWNQVHMGLDLRGGSYLLLQIDTSAIVKQDLNALVDQTRQTLRNAGLGYTGLHADLAGNQVVLHPLEGQGPQAMTALQKLITYTPGSSSPSVALSQAADGSIAIAIPQATQAARNSQAVDQAITIIQRRIDGSGVLNPSIQRQGKDQIVVQLPGISDPERVKTLIGTTAHMTFQMVDSTAAPGPVAPLGDEQLPMADNPQQTLDVYSNVAVDGASLENAQASTDPQSGQWVVNFSLNALGARQFADVTTANVGKLFAIVLDGKIIEAPVIREPITGGSGQISGNFTAQSATDLALLLRAGALPAPLNIVEEQSVGPELGADAIRAGALALGAGFVFVLAFMGTFYGLFGWFANIALVMNLFLMLAILSVMGATLTLPGMAGILLTLGMAVDANVLINERVREEVKNGRKPLAALEAGYKRAYGTIIDSNVTTLLAHVTLFIFGSPPVRGFAVTICAGIITTMFTATVLVRLLTGRWYISRRPASLPV
ncbi:preprotein translocase subunit SecD/SecD/SecF fusion protein [Acidocella aromatica]|uniref:Protein translocase subunit SecD n=1 Tax=Acidocella aromatica TaxID=1303579 RepID=A0A840VCE8_9PROT|nr:preprotein translocase subunit SecD/SecD/SecF fusion protein [Acidocella aromatica]